MSDRPAVEWEPEKPRPGRGLGTLIALAVVAVGTVLSGIRLVAETGAADTAHEQGEAFGRFSAPYILGAIVWGLIVLLSRVRPPRRTFWSDGLAITIAVLIVLSAIASLGRT